MKPLKKATKRLQARQAGWRATLEDLKRSRIAVANPAAAFKMPGSMKRK